MYTEAEFKNLQKGGLFGPACALTFVVFSFLVGQGVKLHSFLTYTDPAPYCFLLTCAGFMLRVAQENREQCAKMFWLHSVVATAMAAYGGGFLAPLIVGHAPTPLLEESFFWLVVFAWYVTHNIPYVSAYWARLTAEKPVVILLSVFFSVFKTQQIVGAVEIASVAIPMEMLGPKARYFTEPWAAMIVCGFLGGCGGAFLPFNKGLSILEEGRRWPVTGGFIAAMIYIYSTRLFGVEKLAAKEAICVLRLIGELFPGTRQRLLDTLIPLTEKAIGVRRAPAKVVPVGP